MSKPQSPIDRLAEALHELDKLYEGEGSELAEELLESQLPTWLNAWSKIVPSREPIPSVVAPIKRQVGRFSGLEPTYVDLQQAKAYIDSRLTFIDDDDDTSIQHGRIDEWQEGKMPRVTIEDTSTVVVHDPNDPARKGPIR